MIEFALACFFLLITPGPGVLSVAGVGSGFGFKAGFSYLWGLCAGNFAVGMAVATGLAAVLFSIPYLRLILLFASIAYLTYLAAKIAFSGNRVALIAPEKAPGFWNGFTLQFINPKAYAVNTALFTGFAFLPASYVLEVAVKIGLLNAFWIPIHFLWLGVGVYLKRLNLPDAVQRLINITMAVTMLAVVGLALWAER
ncbi:MAG: LysE family translocator [Pseudomonadota bacterium]